MAEAEIQKSMVFPLESSSESEAEVSPRGGKLVDFLVEEEETVCADTVFARLQALKIENRQYLLELGTLYQAQAEGDTKLSKEGQELECFFQKNEPTFPNELQKAERSSTLTRLISDPTRQRPKSGASPWSLAITIPKPFKMTVREAQQKAKLMKAYASLEAEREKLEEENQEQIECQKKFRAQPMPAHIFLPLYQEMMEKKEAQRHANVQKRQEFLLYTQKPFSFVEKEERRNKKIQQRILAVTKETENNKQVSKKIPKSVQDSTVNDKLKEAELYRRIRIQMRAKDLLQKSSAPIDICRGMKNSDTSISLKTKQEKMGFLQENFQFRPKINQEVPDFKLLYWAFQREAMRKHEIKEATRNKPFSLHTSNLRFQQRESKEGQKRFHHPTKYKLKKSHTVTGLSSLSPNTLPVYITDSAQRRDSAIRCSLEEKRSKEHGKARWLESYRKRSQAMHKSVNRRAEVLDSHVPLENVFKEKLKQNWLNDQKRKNEYEKELEEMKRRVKDRPYLFEQVTKSDARKMVESQYMSALNQVGLSEEFVNKKGRDTIDLSEEVETRIEIQHSTSRSDTDEATDIL
ncbi:protein FAM161B [Rhinatrema bivittatum]|uniref:protein FAM161B n=1 Tax=Rhinatrema bivittatum TaxID=194408 RepID=UPI00112E83C1|nr:protein FAM161B [Rhinatrema bivittatum]